MFQYCVLDSFEFGTENTKTFIKKAHFFNKIKNIS